MIVFEKLNIISFKSIFNCEIDFTDLDNQLYSLEGINNTTEFASSNGAGKTTLLQALMFALYGTIEDNVSVKKAEYQNKNTSTKLKVFLQLSIQGVTYVIERTLNGTKLYKEGEDISELTKTDTDKKFQDILGLTKAEFNNFTYIPQSSSSSFLSKTPMEKLNCIRDFIFGDELNNIQNSLAQLTKQYKEQLASVQQVTANIQGKISTLNSIIQKQQSQVKQSDEKQSLSLPYSLDEYKEQLAEVKKKQKDSRKLEQEVETCNFFLNSIRNKLKALKENYNSFKNSICPTCGQEIDNVDSHKQHCREEAAKLKNEASKYKEKLEDAQAKLKNYDRKSLSQEVEHIIQCITKLEEQKKSQQRQQQDINTYMKQVEEYDRKNKEYIAQIEELELKIRQIMQLTTYFKADFIRYIQQAFITEVESYLNIYCHDVFDGDFNLVFTNNSLELTIDDKPYSYFSGGERQRIDFILVFAIKIVLTHFTNKCTNLFIADESLSGQDSEAFENCLELISSLTIAEDLTTILVSHRDIEYHKNKILIIRSQDSTDIKIVNE